MKVDECGMTVFDTAEEAVKVLTEYGKKKHRGKPKSFELRNLEFEGVDFRGLDMGDLTCEWCSFIRCNFSDAKFNHSAWFEKCHFDRCWFDNADLCLSYVSDSIFNRCDFYQAIVYGIHLDATFFHRCNMNEVWSEDKDYKEMLIKLERAETEHRLVEFSITEQRERFEEDFRNEENEEEANDDE